MPAQAATYYWDGSTVTIDGISGGGDGTWSVGTAGWEDGTSAQNWANTNAAVFAGSGGTVTLTGTPTPTTTTVTAGDYTFSGALGGTGAVTVTGGSLKLIGAYTNAHTYAISSGAVLDLNGGGGWSTTTFNGAGTLRLSGGSFSGASAATMALSAGGLIDIVSGATLVNPYNSNLRINWTNNKASMTVNGTFDLNDGASPIVDALNGSGTISRTRNTNGVTTLQVGVNNGGGTFSGSIPGVSAARSPAILMLGTGTQTFSGANTYYATTTIRAGNLVAGSNGAFGNSSIVLGDGSTLAGDLAADTPGMLPLNVPPPLLTPT